MTGDHVSGVEGTGPRARLRSKTSRRGTRHKGAREGHAERSRNSSMRSRQRARLPPSPAVCGAAAHHRPSLPYVCSVLYRLGSHHRTAENCIIWLLVKLTSWPSVFIGSVRGPNTRTCVGGGGGGSGGGGLVRPMVTPIQCHSTPASQPPHLADVGVAPVLVVGQHRNLQQEAFQVGAAAGREAGGQSQRRGVRSGVLDAAQAWHAPL